MYSSRSLEMHPRLKRLFLHLVRGHLACDGSFWNAHQGKGPRYLEVVEQGSEETPNWPLGGSGQERAVFQWTGDTQVLIPVFSVPWFLGHSDNQSRSFRMPLEGWVLGVWMVAWLSVSGESEAARRGKKSPLFPAILKGPSRWVHAHRPLPVETAHKYSSCWEKAPPAVPQSVWSDVYTTWSYFHRPRLVGPGVNLWAKNRASVERPVTCNRQAEQGWRKSAKPVRISMYLSLQSKLE